VSIAAAIEEMIEEGFTLDQAIKAAKIVEANLAMGAALTARQVRNQRYYQARKERRERLNSDALRRSQDASETVLKASETVLIKTPLARVEDSSTTTEISGKKDKNIRQGVLIQTPRDILLECLSPDSADAVLAHRKAKRCPLTVRAAQLLAKGFTATGDPNAAADMMIERGWQGFKPEWYDNERAGNGQQRQGKGSIVEAGRRLTERLVAAERERELQAVDRVDDGDPAVRFLPTFGRQRS
jgi:hypothetical protein